MDPGQTIAIVGIGGIFPGADRAGDVAQLWRDVKAGRSVAREAPAGRWPLSRDDVFAAGGARPDRVYSMKGCFVEGAREEMARLGISRELLGANWETLDEMFWLLLIAGKRSWGDVKGAVKALGRVGVIVGNIALPTEGSSAWAEAVLGPVFAEKVLGRRVEPAGGVEKLNRYVAGLPAAMLAKVMGFGGCAFTLDAACASSLYAMTLAAEELKSGRADVMVTGGVSRPDSLYTQMGFSQLKALSPSGRCAPFDRAADGLVVGEGAGILVLKRLGDALRDGDRIYATVAGAGLSNDVAGNLMQPESGGQLRAMRAAYRAAGWTPGDVELMECHGTGTPVGDGVEVESLRRLWDGVEGTRPVLGSVKSNVGHLLTAAGAAGMIKVLMGMQEGVLPPTAHFEHGAAAVEGSGFRVLRAAEAWERRAGRGRRAAVSGFGFGGINAHVLIEEWVGDATMPAAGAMAAPRLAGAVRPSKIAIVGMGAQFGGWKGLKAVRERVFGTGGVEAEKPRHWWGVEGAGHRGFFVGEVAVPVGRFRIPPAELAEMLPQQLLMLQVAADAFEDAGLGEVEGERLDTGVFVGIGLDLNTTNFRLRWMLKEKARGWARELGRAMTAAEMEAWVEDLRAAAGPALNANRTMGALGGIVASRVARAFHVGGPSFTISSEETSALNALEVGVRALQRGEIDVALVGAVDLAGDVRAVLGRGDAAGTIVGEGAGAVVLKRHADAVRDGDRIYAVIDGVESRMGDGEAAATVGYSGSRVEERIGNAGAAAGMATLITAAMALHHETVPTAEGARYWLQDKDAGSRRARVAAVSVGGTHVHVLMEEGEKRRVAAVQEMAESLFVVRGETTPEVLTRLALLGQRAAEFSGSVAGLARAWFQEYRGVVGGTIVAIVAETVDEIAALVGKAREAVEKGKRMEGEQIFYSPERLGGKVAFVYPGSGTPFAGMGRELAAQFPGILHRQGEESGKLASQFTCARFWDGTRVTEVSPRDAIFAQVSLGAFVTDVLAGFNVKPVAVIGYSLGESTALISTRAWRDRDEMFARMQASPLFVSELTGRCEAARRAWKMAEDEEVDWLLGVVNRSADKVRAVMAGRERVYLMIVNTPGECVIGGQRAAVEAVVKELGCRFMVVQGVTTVHCSVAREVEGAYRALHLLETTPPAGVTFYSGVRGGAYEVTRESAAESIVGQAVGAFDFTQVIAAAYADGVRKFVEVGPGGTCTRMIGKILKGKPHVARAVCMANQGEVGSLLRVLGQLIAEGMPVALDAIYGGGVHEPVEVVGAKMIRVKTGGDAFEVPTMPVKAKVERTPARQIAANAAPLGVASVAATSPLLVQMAAVQVAHAKAQEAFLRLSAGNMRAMTEALSFQMAVLSGGGEGIQNSEFRIQNEEDVAGVAVETGNDGAMPVLDRGMCLEFAVGSLGRVLGEEFTHVDAYPTRVRLPDEPLMLVDRIMRIEGEANGLTHGNNGGGRVVTEHDVLEEAWYLDGGRIPTCIAVEAGQADLFLSGYLGIDSITRGRAVYRLLDAVVTFHGDLPMAGETIVYDIGIEHFFRQGETHLFRFHFEATVNGKPFLTMTKGCAGFFTEEELAAGQGIVLTSIDKRAVPGKRPADYEAVVPMRVEAYSDTQLTALRGGDLAACFGEAFRGLAVTRPSTLPSGRMTLVHRILKLDPTAGRYGLGQITGEADIRPDDWFLTCHFVDDRVMPGTLMYECCLHTLRVYLLRMGWVGEVGQVAYEPVVGAASQLKCRGQVTASTKKVQYEVSLKEIGFAADGTPFVIADALMSGDGRAIVQMTNMSVRLTGLSRAKIEALWGKSKIRNSASRMEWKSKQVLFDTDRITAFALGKPSEAFGEPYKMFDPGEKRKIARLPGPPFQFLDRVTRIEGCEPFQLKAGGVIEAEYDVPRDAWYFAANGQRGHAGEMPFSVLLEIALQPCGWLAGYLGSALVSDVDMRFRNLGGTATQLRAVTAETGTLTTEIKMTGVSHSGGMVIQHFDMAVRCDAGEVYRGNTYFGFFSAEALATQVGIRDAARFVPGADETARAEAFAYPTESPFPDRRMRMVDRVVHFDPEGGPKGLGSIRGKTAVDAGAWFFKAHFFEDPVWPGSLGLESFIQLLKVVAVRRWGAGNFETLAHGEKHAWVYRGQILPTDGEVTVEAAITAIDESRQLLRADGFLVVDGRVIYQMKDFAIRMGEES